MNSLKKLLDPVGRAAIAVLLFLPLANAQCGNKTGFAKQLCQAQANSAGTALGNAANIDLSAFTGATLSTSLSDAIHLSILPPSIEPQEFEPLLKLPRNDQGAFILKAGIFQVYVESFSLEPYDPGTPRGLAFFPAPIKGRTAKVISDTLKYAELHPDVQQAWIQNFLGLTVYGKHLEEMPQPTQQAAAKILPKETLVLIHGASQGRKMRDFLLKQIGRQVGAKDPKAAQEITGAINKEKQIDQAVGATAMIGALKNNAPALGIAADSAPRGSWAEMPGGFYVRYLPESYVRTKVQIIVPEAAMEHIDPKAPLTFDPTQYLAVHVGTPAQRLGITLRPVGGR
jgi:hypothetical protein